MKWVPADHVADENRRVLIHRSREVELQMNTEDIGFFVDNPVAVAVERAKRKDPAATVLIQEKKTVNGNEVTHLRISLRLRDGTPMILSYLIYAGREGSAQILVATPAAIFEMYEADIRDVLGGLEIVQVTARP